MVLFFVTASLSQYILAEPSTIIPNILNLHLKPSIISNAVFIAQNLAPNVLASTVVYDLLYQCIGALLMKMRTPV